MVQCYQKDYPRPQFVRKSWINLNGTWDFAFDDGNIGEASGWPQHIPAGRTIKVPFSYESEASGIGDTAIHNQVWYEKTFCISAACLGSDHLMLHLEGCDYITKVWLNGIFLGSHTGGYSRFSFDLTNALRDGENKIVIRAEDSMDDSQPRGKQRWLPENFACWYTQTTGIWKSVWMEQVPCRRLETAKITPLFLQQSVRFDFEVDAADYSGLMLDICVSFAGKTAGRVIIPVDQREVHTQLDLLNTEIFARGVMPWSPLNPNLYDVTFTLSDASGVIDTVGSYFGMREIRIKGSNVLLNGEPLYQRLILDQGYWKDSLLTPPDEAAIIEDIDKIMQLGYNGVRKHQKIEDERFLYWCDVKGLLVWSEMAAEFRFHDGAAAEFTRQWMDIVRQNYNHPSIITWTPFNESWGIPEISRNAAQQHFTECIYHLTKTFDESRPVIVNDGWEHTVSDIITLHDYEASGDRFLAHYMQFRDEILGSEISHNGLRFAMAEGFAYHGQPVIISEYGGIAFDDGQAGWGYNDKVADETAFLERFDKITTAIKELPFACGYCYTQVTDVQQEINGLMDMERNFKVNPEKICEINTRCVSTRLSEI